MQPNDINDLAQYSSRKLWEILHGAMTAACTLPTVESGNLERVREELNRRNPGDANRSWAAPH